MCVSVLMLVTVSNSPRRHRFISDKESAYLEHALGGDHFASRKVGLFNISSIFLADCVGVDALAAHSHVAGAPSAVHEQFHVGADGNDTDDISAAVL